MRPLPLSNPGRAPWIASARCWFFLGILIFSLASCDKQNRDHADVSQTSEPTLAETPARSKSGKKSSTRSTKWTASGLRFVSYNVENWLTMERYEDRKPVGNTPKPTGEKNQVIRMLAEARPDIVGLCEIGTKQDLQEIQRLLKDAGIPLPHLHHSTGSDPVRSLGLLSRHPIVSTASSTHTEYRLQGKTFHMGRGVLDATVDVDGSKLRFLGVHLKSKREVPEGDQEAMRVSEARLLRRHVDDIFQSDPDAPLIVYGDFNDTYPSTTVRTITSHPNPSFRLRPVYLRDSRGEAWTHHWNSHDIYSRIDFVTLADSLRDHVDYKASRIIDDAGWDKASDHRPLLVVFR